jgi:hypothetical protein
MVTPRRHAHRPDRAIFPGAKRIHVRFAKEFGPADWRDLNHLAVIPNDHVHHYGAVDRLILWLSPKLGHWPLDPHAPDHARG